MQFKTIMGLFALAGLGAAMPTDENVARATTENFCCTGIVVPHTAGLGCAKVSPSTTSCTSPKNFLTCADGAIVFPPTVSVAIYFLLRSTQSSDKSLRALTPMWSARSRGDGRCQTKILALSSLLSTY